MCAYVLCTCAYMYCVLYTCIQCIHFCICAICKCVYKYYVVTYIYECKLVYHVHTMFIFMYKIHERIIWYQAHVVCMPSHSFCMCKKMCICLCLYSVVLFVHLWTQIIELEYILAERSILVVEWERMNVNTRKTIFTKVCKSISMQSPVCTLHIFVCDSKYASAPASFCLCSHIHRCKSKSIYIFICSFSNKYLHS